MSLIELSQTEEIDRLHRVIDARLFGPRADDVREMQVKIRTFADAFSLLDVMGPDKLAPEAREVIEACKVKLGMVQAPNEG